LTRQIIESDFAIRRRKCRVLLCWRHE
jgi:hypothetical protein